MQPGGVSENVGLSQAAGPKAAAPKATPKPQAPTFAAPKPHAPTFAEPQPQPKPYPGSIPPQRELKTVTGEKLDDIIDARGIASSSSSSHNKMTFRAPENTVKEEPKQAPQETKMETQDDEEETQRQWDGFFRHHELQKEVNAELPEKSEETPQDT